MCMYVVMYVCLYVRSNRSSAKTSTTRHLITYPCSSPVGIVLRPNPPGVVGEDKGESGSQEDKGQGFRGSFIKWSKRPRGTRLAKVIPL